MCIEQFFIVTVTQILQFFCSILNIDLIVPAKTEDTNLKQSLVFEITSAYINEKEGTDKKHVVYTLQVRHITTRDDASPAILERRYTDFLNLYNGLRAEQPQLMASVPFPKKVLIGKHKLISLKLKFCFLTVIPRSEEC